MNLYKVTNEYLSVYIPATDLKDLVNKLNDEEVNKKRGFSKHALEWNNMSKITIAIVDSNYIY